MTDISSIRAQKDPTGVRRRVAGIAVALGLEALLILALLSLQWSDPGTDGPDTALASFDVSVPPEQTQEEAPATQETEAPATTPADMAPAPAPMPAIRADPALPQPPAPADVAPPPPVPAPLPTQPSKPQPSAPPPASRPVQGPMQGPRLGPGDRARMADTEVVGTAPNGQPLYAAAWYRRPYPAELDGYLSTATGPGWGLIACRTVADFRVDDCVALEESPRGSNINRAVLAAAWQFKVRPPRVGGRSLVGSWVRIRIDYERR